MRLTLPSSASPPTLQLVSPNISRHVAIAITVVAILVAPCWPSRSVMYSAQQSGADNATINPAALNSPGTFNSYLLGTNCRLTPPCGLPFPSCSCPARAQVQHHCLVLHIMLKSRNTPPSPVYSFHSFSCDIGRVRAHSAPPLSCALLSPFHHADPSP